MNPAANPASLWLSRGGRAGQPLTPGALVQQFRAAGVAATQTRTAAFPPAHPAGAPRSSRALGYSPGTAMATSSSPAEPGTATRPPAPGAERGTQTAQQHVGSDSPSGAPGTADRQDVADEAANVST
jgi:hypothetical protein